MMKKHTSYIDPFFYITFDKGYYNWNVQRRLSL